LFGGDLTFFLISLKLHNKTKKKKKEGKKEKEKKTLRKSQSQIKRGNSESKQCVTTSVQVNGNLVRWGTRVSANKLLSVFLFSIEGACH